MLHRLLRRLLYRLRNRQAYIISEMAKPLPEGYYDEALVAYIELPNMYAILYDDFSVWIQGDHDQMHVTIPTVGSERAEEFSDLLNELSKFVIKYHKESQK